MKVFIPSVDNMTFPTHQDTGEPDDEQWPSQLWKAININMNKNEMIENRMTTVEHAMEEHGRRNADINRKLEMIFEKLELVLINQEKASSRISITEKEISKLWSFPLKITAAIIAVGGASAVVLKFSLWLISNHRLDAIPPR